jgi:mannose-6-phosphate isomerase-like protein (cupin superfamily)
LHGRLRLRLGDETHDARTGSCVVIPHRTPHHFRDLGRDPASLLAVFTPSSGIEQFFEAFAAGERQR